MLHKISAKSQILMDQGYRGSQKRRKIFCEIPDFPIWGVTGPLQPCQGASDLVRLLAVPAPGEDEVAGEAARHLERVGHEDRRHVGVAVEVLRWYLS